MFGPLVEALLLVTWAAVKASRQTEAKESMYRPPPSPAPWLPPPSALPPIALFPVTMQLCRSTAAPEESPGTTHIPPPTPEPPLPPLVWPSPVWPAGPPWPPLAVLEDRVTLVRLA